jgi:hypothetical protein
MHWNFLTLSQKGIISLFKLMTLLLLSFQRLRICWILNLNFSVLCTLRVPNMCNAKKEQQVRDQISVLRPPIVSLDSGFLIPTFIKFRIVSEKFYRQQRHIKKTSMCIAEKNEFITCPLSITLYPQRLNIFLFQISYEKSSPPPICNFRFFAWEKYHFEKEGNPLQMRVLHEE